MTDADHLQLLFGPYRTSRFRYGATLRCEPRTLGAVSARRRGLVCQGLPAPRGEGYAAGAGHRGRSWLVGQSTPL